MHRFSSGLQSPWTARSTQGHDKGRLHGETQSLVLLHCPRTSSVWNQSDLGLQPGQATGHCHPHAGHSEVGWCTQHESRGLLTCFLIEMKNFVFIVAIYKLFILTRLWWLSVWPQYKQELRNHFYYLFYYYYFRVSLNSALCINMASFSFLTHYQYRCQHICFPLIEI